jgi:hypothetical protein
VPLLQSTPIKVGGSSLLPFTTTQIYRVGTVAALAREIKIYIIGPMPVADFLDVFLPSKDRRSERLRTGAYNNTVGLSTELEMYDPFVSPSISALYLLTSHNYCYL